MAIYRKRRSSSRFSKARNGRFRRRRTFVGKRRRFAKRRRIGGRGRRRSYGRSRGHMARRGRFGRKGFRSRGRSRLLYEIKWIDIEAISNNYNDGSSTPTHLGVGIQGFHDMRALGELGTMYAVMDYGMQQLVRKWVTNPLGPKWGGVPWPWAVGNNSSQLPDVLSRYDPNRTWFSMKETLKHEIYNISNTTAYMTVTQFVPKRHTSISAINGGPGLSETLDCMPVSSTFSNYPAAGGSGAANAVHWAYPTINLGGMTIQDLNYALFMPTPYNLNLFTTPRLMGAQLMVSAPFYARGDMRQDVSGNFFNATNLAATTPHISQTYMSQVTGSSQPGAGGQQLTDYDYTAPLMNGLDISTHTATPTSYASSIVNGDPDQSFLAADYSLWPQYREKKNPYLRRLFRMRSRRFTLQPGQKAEFTVRGKKFSFNPVRERLLGNAATDFGCLSFLNASAANVQTQMYAQGTNWDTTARPAQLQTGSGTTPALGYDLTEAVPPVNMMVKRCGDPTTTTPISYCIRGQHAAGSGTTASAMNLMPAVCMVKKTMTVRYGVKMTKPLGVAHRSAWFDNRSNINLAAPYTTALQYSMQFPVVTSATSSAAVSQQVPASVLGSVEP